MEGSNTRILQEASAAKREARYVKRPNSSLPFPTDELKQETHLNRKDHAMDLTLRPLSCTANTSQPSSPALSRLYLVAAADTRPVCRTAEASFMDRPPASSRTAPKSPGPGNQSKVSGPPNRGTRGVSSRGTRAAGTAGRGSSLARARGRYAK